MNVREILMRSYRWIAPFMLVLSICVVYSNSMTVSFQFDDTHTVQANIAVRSLKNIPRYFVDAKTFSYRPENSGYRPMTTLALALGFAISPGQVLGHHIIKLIEHCCVALMILVLGIKLLPRSSSTGLELSVHRRYFVAWAGALLFGLHRANTETVNYISAISTLQAGLFYLTAFFLYLRWRESKRNIFRLGSLVLYMASMMSKEEGATLPAILIAYEWIYGLEPDETYVDRFLKRWVFWAKMVAPWVAVFVLFVLLRTFIQPDIADKSRGNISIAVYFITQIRSWLHYWYLFVWPVHLNADNLAFEFSQSLEDWRVWVAAIAHLILLATAFRLGKKRRFVWFAVIWFYITIVPASSFFPLFEAVNEHRMYIPYAMASLLAAWLWLDKTQKVSAWGAGVFIAMCLLMGVGTHARNEVWQTDISLWEDVIAKNPNSARAMNVLGVSLMNRGDFKRGVPLLQKCRQIAPTYLPCIVHLSIAYAREQKFEKGLEILRYGNSLDPDYVHINFHLGVYYKDYLADYSNAYQHLMKVYEASSGRFFQGTLKLAEMAMEDGNLSQANALVKSVLEADASNGDARDVLARILMLEGHLKEANEIYRYLLASQPDNIRYQLGVANVSERMGQFDVAKQAYTNAVTRYPDYIQGWSGLERVAQKLGDADLARSAKTQREQLLLSRQLASAFVSTDDQTAIKEERPGWQFVPSLFFIGEKPRQVHP